MKSCDFSVYFNLVDFKIGAIVLNKYLINQQAAPCCKFKKYSIADNIPSVHIPSKFNSSSVLRRILVMSLVHLYLIVQGTSAPNTSR